MTKRLIQAYKQGGINIGDYINYSPDYREYVITEKETGWSKSQVVCTEKDLKYQFAGIIQGKLMLVADAGSNNKIVLNSKTGYVKGPDVLQRCIKECYSSEKLDAKGFCLTVETFEQLAAKIRESNDTYLLASACDYIYSDYVFSGVYYVLGGNLYRHILFYSNASTNKCSSSVRPAVILPDDIQIDQHNNLVYR